MKANKSYVVAALMCSTVVFCTGLGVWVGTNLLLHASFFLLSFLVIFFLIAIRREVMNIPHSQAFIEPPGKMGTLRAVIGFIIIIFTAIRAVKIMMIALKLPSFLQHPIVYIIFLYILISTALWLGGTASRKFPHYWKRFVL